MRVTALSAYFTGFLDDLLFCRVAIFVRFSQFYATFVAFFLQFPRKHLFRLCKPSTSHASRARQAPAAATRRVQGWRAWRRRGGSTAPTVYTADCAKYPRFAAQRAHISRTGRDSVAGFARLRNNGYFASIHTFWERHLSHTVTRA